MKGETQTKAWEESVASSFHATISSLPSLDTDEDKPYTVPK